MVKVSHVIFECRVINHHPILNSIASNEREYDVKLVVDFYHESSIKSGIRSERAIASRVLFELDGNLPRHLPELLSVE